MNISNRFLKISGFLTCLLVAILVYGVRGQKSKLPCIRVYDAILEASEEYNIPSEYLFAIAYAETRYQGPHHTDYNPAQVSSASALGPMQIMPSTANWIMKEEIPRTELKTNIELNVDISARLLRSLKNRFGDWKIVFGYYNTGYAKVNNYAIRVYNKQYTWKNEEAGE